MATYPKVLIKPSRTYPANQIHAIRFRVNMVSPNPAIGERALVLNKPVNVGTIPAGAFIMAAESEVEVAFAPAAVINVGTEAVPGAFLPTASIAPGTVAYVPNIVGPGMGFQTDRAIVWILMTGAQATAGVLDFVLPFYVQRD